MTRKEKIVEVFENINPGQRELITQLIDEVLFLEKQMTELKKLPFIKTKPDNPSIQKTTPAAKLYKECSQSYMNAIRILLSIVKQESESEADRLKQMFAEFMPDE